MWDIHGGGGPSERRGQKLLTSYLFLNDSYFEISAAVLWHLLSNLASPEHLDRNRNLTLSTDEDDGTQTEDDEHQHHQQPHQVGVQDGPPSAVEAPLVKSEQDECSEPPGEKGRGQRQRRRGWWWWWWRLTTDHRTRRKISKAPGKTRSSLAITQRRPKATIPGMLTPLPALNRPLRRYAESRELLLSNSSIASVMTSSRGKRVPLRQLPSCPRRSAELRLRLQPNNQTYQNVDELRNGIKNYVDINKIHYGSLTFTHVFVD